MFDMARECGSNDVADLIGVHSRAFAVQQLVLVRLLFNTDAGSMGNDVDAASVDSTGLTLPAKNVRLLFRHRFGSCDESRQRLRRRDELSWSPTNS